MSCRLPEEVAHARTWHNLDPTATAPDLHRELHMVAAPFKHAGVEQLQLLKPILTHCEDPTRGARARIRLRGRPNCTIGVGEYQIQVPLVSPVAPPGL